jgi:choice-of-anchor C domain-containing protein
MKTKRGALAGSLMVAALAAGGHGAHAADSAPVTLGANAVPNGGFERGADPGLHLAIAPGSPLLANWTVVGSEVSVYGSYWKAEEGARSLALANPTSSPTTASGVKQSIPTTPGQRYQLTFYQSGNPSDHQPSTVRMQIGTQSHDFTYQAAATAGTTKMDWVQRIVTFTATAASTPLSFLAIYTPGNAPLGLDNVQVRAIQTSTDSSGTPAVKPGITLAAASVAVGGSQTATITAAPQAAVALVIDAPDGSQIVVPARTDASGHYAYTWSIAISVHGTAHVLVDSAGVVARADFTVR